MTKCCNNTKAKDGYNNLESIACKSALNKANSDLFDGGGQKAEHKTLENKCKYVLTFAYSKLKPKNWCL